MKTWIGEAVVYLGSLTSEEIKDPKHKAYFKDTDNPTEEELYKFFKQTQAPMGYGAPINEMADASIDITETTEEVGDSDEEDQ
jgi:hypothetical protein